MAACISSVSGWGGDASVRDLFAFFTYLAFCQRKLLAAVYERGCSPYILWIMRDIAKNHMLASADCAMNPYGTQTDRRYNVDARIELERGLISREARLPPPPPGTPLMVCMVNSPPCAPSLPGAPLELPCFHPSHSLSRLVSFLCTDWPTPTTHSFFLSTPGYVTYMRNSYNNHFFFAGLQHYQQNRWVLNISLALHAHPELGSYRKPKLGHKAYFHLTSCLCLAAFFFLCVLIKIISNR